MKESWMDKFVEYLQEVLEDESRSAGFVDRYDGEWKNRTELMLGNGQTRKDGIIYKTLKKLYVRELNLHWDKAKNIKQDIAFERYADCIIYKEFDGQWDDWWRGEAFNDLVIEVENNITEFIGTFSDLLRIQARKKAGIFYYDNKKDKQSFLEERKKGLQQALSYFADKGFIESEGTEYLFVFLPESLKDVGKTFTSKIFILTIRIILDGQQRIDVDKTVNSAV